MIWEAYEKIVHFDEIVTICNGLDQKKTAMMSRGSCVYSIS